ncbi:hypothetical protein RUM44_007457 [Polyplax serrata]|uniref:Nuclear receptor coactivator 2 n=1 Tax=Polyplax serrata TaxID=468196 RepID=A0ABR1B0S7_POLSC
MSAVTGATNKKRKKTDSKPQSQINKCLNEKRRREQENIYIEELAELISASFADMSSLSVKPDKCAILQETVNQIRHIKQQENCSGDAAVQQGEVSSSNPTVLRNEVFGPLLLEALDGFLFIVNLEGKIEFVTDNVHQFIKFTKDDLYGKSIYNIIHHGDHARFSSSLLPMTIGWPESNPQNSRRTFNCRLLIKPPDDQEETMEEKQQRISKYENMQIQCTQVQLNKEKGDSDDVTPESSEVGGGTLMCVARRIPQNEKSVGTPIEQFTMKLDTSGKIVGIDTIGVSATYSQYLNKDLMGQIIQEMCHQQDLQKLASHLKEALTTGQSTSGIYRLRVGTPEKYVLVQTKSKLFKANSTMPQEPDFIMATHSIIGDNELSPPEGVASSPRSVASLGQQSTSSSGSVGGPLMSGPITTRGGVSSTGYNDTITLNASSSYASFTLNPGELSLPEFDFFPTSTWDMMGGPDNGNPHTPWGERPDSRQSLTPVSTPTPRPPSVPGYSPACPSPLNPYSVATQPSPAAATTPFVNNFPFSPIQEQSANSSFLEEPKNNKEGVMDGENGTSASGSGGAGGGGNAGPSQESGRLRNLLTKRASTSEEGEFSEETEARNKNRILKGLLNQEEEEEASRPASRVLAGRLPSSDMNKPPTNNNNMLLKLLNEKNDDDDVESKKQNALLQQLLKEQDKDTKPQLGSLLMESTQQAQEDTLLKSLGFRNTTPSPPSGSDGLTVSSLIGNRKRPSDEGDGGGPSKRDSTLHTSNVSSTGNSKLWEKNKMLASLLAKQPSKTTPIPPIPTSVISATPQDKLPKIVDRLKPAGVSGQWSANIQNPGAAGPGRPQAPGAHANPARGPRPPGNQFLSQILNQQQDHQQGMHHSNMQMNKQSQGQPPVAVASQQPPQAQQPQQQQCVHPDVNNDHMWDNQSSDPVLSDLLDQVIDIVPDAVCNDSAAIINLLDLDQSTAVNQTPCYQDQLNERLAINAIQKSLMLCESAVKGPASPTITTPSYNSTGQQMSTSQSAEFPPPLVYQVQQQQQQQQPPQQRIRFNVQQQLPGRPGAPHYTVASGSLTQHQQQVLMQRKLLQEQQQKQHKQRLLQQQQQQQMLVPSNAAADQINSSGLQNIDNLLNNTLAPNVSLQRSSSVPESQLSPSYGGQLLNNSNAQISPGGQRLNQQPYSPHSQLASPQQTFNNFPSTGNASGQARLSPHPPSFQQSQLSPRVSQGQQPGYPIVSQTQSQPPQTGAWSQQNVNRLSLQQQQNPMLNAQLTGGYGTGSGRFPVQRQAQPGQTMPSVRSLASPGTPPRQSPFPPEAAFPPPASPTTGGYQNQGQYQQMRLQRAVSAPSATTQLPGGMSSPRQYKEMPPHPFTLPLENHPHHSMYHPHPSSALPELQYSYDHMYGAGGERCRSQPGGGNNNNGINSEYVRQELRAIVGARTQQQQQQQQPQQPSPRQQHIQQVSAADLEALGLTFEISSGPSESPKLWGSIASELGAPSPQPGLSNRTTMEEAQRQSDQKSSLLQKLLSE